MGQELGSEASSEHVRGHKARHTFPTPMGDPALMAPTLGGGDIPEALDRCVFYWGAWSGEVRVLPGPTCCSPAWSLDGGRPPRFCVGTWLSTVSEMLLLLLLLLALLWEGSSSQTLDVQAQVSVQEGLCVQVPCTFHHPSPNYSGAFYGYWFRRKYYLFQGSLMATNDPSQMVEEQARGRFHLLGDPMMNNCSLSITDAQFSDSGSYFFHVENGDEKYSYIWKPLYVDVTDLIQKPDMDIPEVLESGKSVTLKCTFSWACGENRPLKFSWMGAAISSQSGSSGASHSSEFSFIPGHQHHGTNLTCQVTLPGGHLSRERTVHLNVSYAVQNVTITISQDNRTTVWVPGKSSPLVVQEGGSLHLLCAAHSNPPATLSWMLGDQTLASSQPSEDGVLPLDLPHLRQGDGGKYTCHAQHPLGSKQVSLSLSVQCECEGAGDHGVLWSCKASPFFPWWVGGWFVEGIGCSDNIGELPTSSEPWVNSSLSRKVEHSYKLSPYCEVRTHHGKDSLRIWLMPVFSAQDNSSWPLMFTLLRGALMGAGFILTYGLTWLYYTCPASGLGPSQDLPPAPATQGPQLCPQGPSKASLTHQLQAHPPVITVPPESWCPEGNTVVQLCCIRARTRGPHPFSPGTGLFGCRLGLREPGAVMFLS
ncbi:sialic acid-binding Ig-like lectin 14 [Dromiciops gliroides]|uniref:sialic acid-binding Ig-like lectin 14 n=1 Tax=Dromiciops gliroides TaxID=33562 RepID=UPI001CC82EFD|nr:sialic acid-binding Ig-like lectin 14 [Dromiciops gliroides]